MAERQYGSNCFVKFPQECRLHSSVSDSDETTLPECDGGVPVIILLGWAGCVDRHLQKYSAIYEKKYITIRHTAERPLSYLHSSDNKQAALKLAKLIFELNLERHPVFVHMFSNGGGRVYRHLTDIVHHSPEFQRLQLRGTIFDSCPSHRCVRAGIRVFLMLSPHPAPIKYLLATLVFVFYGLLCAVAWAGEFIPYLRSFDDYFDYLNHRDPARCPQLYLYSSTDDFVPAACVEQQIAARRHAGVRVVARRWQDSAHVAHLVAHREVYIATCIDFVESCLTS